MNEHQRAEDHLRVIRALMERATIYRAISAPTALVGGLLALAVAALSARWKAYDSNTAFRFEWGTTLFLTLLANTLYIAGEARRRGDPLISPGMKMALRAVLPAMLVGGFFFFLLPTRGLPPDSHAFLRSCIACHRTFRPPFDLDPGYCLCGRQDAATSSGKYRARTPALGT